MILASPYNSAMRILAAVLVFAGAAGAPLSAAEPVVFIRCGRVIDGRGDQAGNAGRADGVILGTRCA